MKTSPQMPSTLRGIKRQSKKLKRELGIKHSAALKQVASISGYQNYEHARHQLEHRPQSHLVATYLSGYWIDTEAGTSGRETVKLELPKSWAEYISSRQLHKTRKLRRFKRLADDHLHIEDVVGSQDSARRAVNAASREIQFAAATGMRPATRVGTYREFHPERDQKMPGSDHSSYWIDGVTGEGVMVDEPYPSRVKEVLQTRDEWMSRNGFRSMRTSWCGIHVPGVSLHLITRNDSGVALDALIKALDRLPSATVDDPWVGESAPYRPIWLSPMQRMKAPKRLSTPSNRLLPTRRRNNSIGYGGLLVSKGARRPDAQMPIAAHREIGQLLRDIDAMTERRARMSNHLSTVRHRLDDWVQREYDRLSLSDEVFFQLYDSPFVESRTKAMSRVDAVRCLAKLNRIARLLHEHYPDCAPRSDLLHRLDVARDSLTT